MLWLVSSWLAADIARELLAVLHLSGGKLFLDEVEDVRLFQVIGLSWPMFGSLEFFVALFVASWG